MFDNDSDFVFLTFDELARLFDDVTDVRSVVRHRQARHDALSGLEPPFITVAMPPPPSVWRKRAVEDLAPLGAGEVLTGIAACPGTATGRVRVLLDPGQCEDLRPDEILVAPATDPGWTPLFAAAAAVVVDVGAPLSHAAIVSRELGIPCVVSARAATRRLPDGTLVTVNGAECTVTVIETVDGVRG